MKKNNGGFSLVELIVVIAIMAILAGIAVPTYVKYIAEANNATALTALDEAKTSAVAVAVKDKQVAVSKIVVNANATVEVYYMDGTTEKEINFSNGVEYSDFMDDALTTTDLANSKYAKGATWTPNGGWKEVTSNEAGGSDTDDAGA